MAADTAASSCHAQHAGTPSANGVLNGPDFSAILSGRFMIPADEAVQLLDRHHLTTKQLLQGLIAPAAALARPPISGFHVGAVGLGAGGNVYIGVNLEFRGLPLNNSVHAEQFLLSNAAWHRERALLRVAVSAAPCGHCRQLYSELACADDLVFSFPAHAGQPPQEHTLNQLLPHRFGPVDLLDVSTTPLLLQRQDNGIALRSIDRPSLHCSSCSIHSTGDCTLSFCLEHVADAALQAANEDWKRFRTFLALQAYAPYTRCAAGVALLTFRSRIHHGAYLESAAFNPGLPPLQAALVAAIRAGMDDYEEIVDVVLVELPDAPVQFRESTAILLKQISPSAVLTVVPAERGKR